MNAKEEIEDKDIIKHLNAELEATLDVGRKEELSILIKRMEAIHSGEPANIESTFIPTNTLRIVLNVSAPSDLTIGEILEEIKELLDTANRTDGMQCKYKLDDL